MAEGSTLRAPAAGLTAQPMSLEEAIRLLEAGEGEGLLVDLGGGRIATADTPRGAEGLLQRLRGHKMLLALSAEGDFSRLKQPASDVFVAPTVREILDAATRKP